MKNVELPKYTPKTIKKYFQFTIQNSFTPSQTDLMISAWQEFLQNLCDEEKVTEKFVENLLKKDYFSI